MNDARNDILISKVIDNSATDADWRDLTALAEADQTIWRDLAESQRHQQVLSRTLNEAVAVADMIAAPSHVYPERAAEAGDGRRTSTGAWSGWAVAAVIGLVAFASRLGDQVQNSSSLGRTQVAGYGTADEALDAYLNLGREQGRVVGELPSKIIVSARENPEGEGYEVISVQQIVVRQVVLDLFEVIGESTEGRLQLERFKPAPTGF